MTKKIFIIVVLLIFVTSTMSFSLTKNSDGSITLTKEEFIKLDEHIRILEDENNRLKEVNDLLKKKILVLQDKLKFTEEYVNKLEEICEKKESNLQKQLDLLTEKFNLQLKITQDKDNIIEIKNKQIIEANKRTILYAILGIGLGYVINEVVK